MWGAIVAVVGSLVGVWLGTRLSLRGQKELAKEAAAAAEAAWFRDRRHAAYEEFLRACADVAAKAGIDDTLALIPAMSRWVGARGMVLAFGSETAYRTATELHMDDEAPKSEMVLQMAAMITKFSTVVAIETQGEYRHDGPPDAA